MPNTAGVGPDDLLGVVQEICTVDSYDILTSWGSATGRFECIAPEDLSRAWRDGKESITRGTHGSRPQSGSACLAGTSWLNSDVVNATLGRFGAARRLRAIYALDEVGVARVCALNGAYADDEWLQQCAACTRPCLSSEARKFLGQLHAYDPAGIDVFILPVHAGGNHWYLLSADVRGGDCVVRIHEPYGAASAELHRAAGVGFRTLLRYYLRPDATSPPAGEPDLQLCDGPIQDDGHSCGVFTLWAAFECAVLYALGIPWCSAFERQRLAPADLLLLRRFFAQMIHRPIRMSELAERCRQYAIRRQAGGAGGVLPSSGGGGGGDSGGGQPAAQGDSGEGARQRGAPAAGESPAGRLRGAPREEVSGRPGRSRGLDPASHSFLRQSALPRAYAAESSRQPSRKPSSRKKRKASAVQETTLLRFFSAHPSVLAGSPVTAPTRLASGEASGGMERAVVSSGASSGGDGGVYGGEHVSGETDGAFKGGASTGSSGGEGDGAGVAAGSEAVVRSGDVGDGGLSTVVRGGIGDADDCGADIGAGGDAGCGAGGGAVGGISDGASCDASLGEDGPAPGSGSERYYDIHVTASFPGTRYCGAPPRIQAVFEAHDDGSFRLCSPESYDSADDVPVSPMDTAAAASAEDLLSGQPTLPRQRRRCASPSSTDTAVDASNSPLCTPRGVQSSSPAALSDSACSARSTAEPASRSTARCWSSDDGPIERQLFGEEPDDGWADLDEEVAVGPVGRGGQALSLRADGPQYLDDGEMVVMTFNVCGGLAALATAACEQPRAQAAMSTKLDQILSWGRGRGAHVIALQEVKLLRTDVATLRDAGAFGGYEPFLCAAGGRKSACGILFLIDRRMNRTVQSRLSSSDGRFAGVLLSDRNGGQWAVCSVYGPSGAWAGGPALHDAEITYSHVSAHVGRLVQAGIRCVVVGDLNLVARPDDVLAASTPHPEALALFDSILHAGALKDSMPPALRGTGIFTNVMGASFATPEARPFGSAARLDYILVPKEVEVRDWFVAEELSHCSNTHYPVIASFGFRHPKGSGAPRLSSRDNAAADPDRAFQYLSTLSGQSLRQHMDKYKDAWLSVAAKIDGMGGAAALPSQTDLDALWEEEVLGPANAITRLAKEQQTRRPQAGNRKRRSGDHLCDRAQYVQNKLRSAVMRLYQWRAYLRDPPPHDPAPARRRSRVAGREGARRRVAGGGGGAGALGTGAGLPQAQQTIRCGVRTCWSGGADFRRQPCLHGGCRGVGAMGPA